MKWDKYTIDTTTEAEDFISMMLSENGIEGIEIEDNVPLTKEETGEMFIDFPPELPPDEGKSKVSFYLEAGEDHTETLKAVRNDFSLPTPIKNISPFTTLDDWLLFSCSNSCTLL